MGLASDFRTSLIRAEVERALAAYGGVLPLKPAWVARDIVPAGGRLSLPEGTERVGERGWISERWLASTTSADNRVGPADERLSYLALESPTHAHNDARCNRVHRTHGG